MFFYGGYFILSVVVCIGNCAAGEAAEPGVLEYEDHRKVMVVCDADGTERPVTRATDWATRRRHILRGMQQAMGPLPARDALPPLDVQVKGRERGRGFTRLAISFQAEADDRVPVHLYVWAGTTRCSSASSTSA